MKARLAGGNLGVAIVAFLAAATLVTFSAPSAGAAISDSEELTRIPAVGTDAGAEAGRLFFPTGLASDPVTGHIFVGDEGNSRISEFTPWGEFVKAFGYDVAPGAVNEQQEVRVRAAEGEFRLTFGGDTTADLPFDASATEVESELSALASVGPGGVSVEAVPGAANGKTPYVFVVTFEGPLAATNVGALLAAEGSSPLEGGEEPELEVRTRADGTPGGTGLESCTEESGCQAGVAGSGPGQVRGGLGSAMAIAVDDAGNVYVKEGFNLRVQKFDSAGRFVWAAGGEVNKTTSANLCTAAAVASGDICGAGVSGTGPGEFSAGFGFGSLVGLAFCPPSGALCGPGGALYATDKERIQRLGLDGAYEGELAVPGEEVSRIAFDPLGEDFYVIYGSKPGVVRKLDGETGGEIPPVRQGGVSIAANEAGELFAVSEGKVFEYDEAGNPLVPPSCCRDEDFQVQALGINGAGNLHVASQGGHTVDDLGHAFIRIYGPGPVLFEGPPPAPPEITDQYATSVDRTGAVLGAEINPHFFIDTRFYVEYGTSKCSEGGCEATKPAPPGSLLTDKQSGTPVKSPGVFLEGLKPGTTYHYRFVADSPLGGGPVRGIGGTPGLDGAESSFTTYPAAEPLKADCPNQAFRTGTSAPLPDCRAYEMVSPVDKNNGDIKSLLSFNSWETNLYQASTEGRRFTYSSARAFAGAEAGYYTMQYLASREDGVGWRSEALNPAHSHGGSNETQLAFENAFKAFSPDLCRAWLVAPAEPVLDPAAPANYHNPYRRENCGAIAYETLIAVQPTVKTDKLNAPEIQGASADGKAAIFRLRDKLTEDAATDRWQAYYASDRELRLLCVLPGGTASGGHCSAGTGQSVSAIGVDLDAASQHRLGNVTGAISADGTRAYWTDSGSEESGAGKVYLRLNPGEEQSAMSGTECLEAEKACTVEVSETKSTKASRFLAASLDGARALFEVTEGTLEGNLYRFDLGAGDSSLIAGDTLGVAGASEDLSRVYFVSTEALAGTTGAVAGQPNLYLDEEGTKTFVATLSAEDVLNAPGTSQQSHSNTSVAPIYHAARATADGSHLVFISTESLTGYDTTDQVTGQADSQVYLYRAGAPGPVCVSCNPSGARPLGRLVRGNGKPGSGLPAAAMLTTPNTMLQTPRALSTDGSRLYFTAYDALLPRDTNGKADVYQWQAASGPEECKSKGAELYVESSGGCLSLISTGQSPQDSEFLDASADGSDVFFTTNASLLPQDPGLIDVYDARQGGGLPPPPPPPEPCQGEACQLAAPPPTDPTPASASFRGQGNPTAKGKPRRRCAKGKARRRGRCVKRRGARKNAQPKRRGSKRPR